LNFKKDILPGLFLMRIFLSALICSTIIVTSTLAGAQDAFDEKTETVPVRDEGSVGEEEFETLDSLFFLYQPYLTNISAYEPIYFLVGTDPAKSKFQFSFKYRLLNSSGSLAKKYRWTEGLHMGYTQTSFWNLKDESRPFEDTSYKPELFHLTRNIAGRPRMLQGLFFQTGVQHESNGQAESLSRSTNYFYFRPLLVFFSKKTKLGLGIAPKFWTYFDNSDENTELPDYRGYFSFDLIVGKADSFVLSSSLRWAKEGGSVQTDLSLPVDHNFSGNVNVYLHLQYVNAMAESLINYKDRNEALRIGFSFVR